MKKMKKNKQKILKNEIEIYLFILRFDLIPLANIMTKL